MKIKSEYCCKVIKREFNETAVMTKKDYKEFQNLLNTGFVNNSTKKVMSK